MKKSVTKRIKITRQGKIMRRAMSVDHFRTRKSTKNLRNKRSRRSLNSPLKRIIGY